MVHLRFLQLQHAVVHDADGMPVAELTDADGTSWLTWDEAVEHELTFELSEFDLEAGGTVVPVTVAGGEDVELLVDDGRVGAVVRRRWPLTAEMRIATAPADGCLRPRRRGASTSTTAPAPTRTRRSGTRSSAPTSSSRRTTREFVSLLDPPEELAAAAAAARQHRCWPVLGRRPGDTDVVLGLPIILYDHPEIAAREPGRPVRRHRDRRDPHPAGA